MKFKLLIFLISLMIAMTGFCQDKKPTFQSNSNIEFYDFLNGVKQAYVVQDEALIKSISEGKNPPAASAIMSTVQYLTDMGFVDVKWGTFENRPSDLASICDLVLVVPEWRVKNNTISNIRVDFVSCNRDIFRFESTRAIVLSEYRNIQKDFYQCLFEMYHTKKTYNSYQRLFLPSEMTEWKEESLKTHFTKNGIDMIEGIYENTISSATEAKYKIGVVKADGVYNIIYLSGALNYLDWNEGEIKAKLSATATPDLFKAEWKMGNKFPNPNTYINFEKGLMQLVMQDKDKQVYLKLFPTSNDNASTTKAPVSGTGFGISSNGLIVTNSHVINGASKIRVRGVRGDFEKSLSAKLILEDTKNDLAIIQINDTSFHNLGTVPYIISTKTTDVGSSVFALGYPLKAIMGDEVKLTNGIISSKTGFQGDVTSYQISVPLQPGNSGGPLFDSNGNLVGIVNARLTIGENVSYAIKAPYLTNLIELLPTRPKLTTINTLAGKQFTDQVKIISKFVYIIDVN